MDRRRKEKKYSKDYVWAFTTYFTEGFPYTIIRSISLIFFRDLKVSLEAIGLTSLFDLPWILKFLWGPQVDEYSTKRRWLLTMQFLFFIIILLTAILAPVENGVQYISILFFIGAFIAATHDIAIDGYYMEALDPEGQAKFLGYRVMAYRAAMITGSSLIVHLGTTSSWVIAFFAAAGIFGAFLLYHFFFLKEVEEKKKRFALLFNSLWSFKRIAILGSTLLVVVGIRMFFKSDFYKEVKSAVPLLNKITFSHAITMILLIGLVIIAMFRQRIKNKLMGNPDSHYSQAFISFVDRNKIGLILFFIIMLRAGEFMVQTMVRPFWVDLGIKTHISWLQAVVGLPFSIVGAIFGGWMISRFTLKKVIFPFILAQNLTNIIYMGLAFHLNRFILLNTGSDNPVSLGALNMAATAAVHAFDQFAGGLGMAVLITFLMNLCQKSHKAAHYAIGSGLMGLSGMFSGIISGFIASWFGYPILFAVSFLISIPAIAVIPFLPDNGPGAEKKSV